MLFLFYICEMLKDHLDPRWGRSHKRHHRPAQEEAKIASYWSNEVLQNGSIKKWWKINTTSILQLWPSLEALLQPGKFFLIVREAFYEKNSKNYRSDENHQLTHSQFLSNIYFEKINLTKPILNNPYHCLSQSLCAV